MNTLICDLDGVVYLGDEEIPGAGGALRRLDDAGWQLLFCTNNATRTPRQTADKIRRLTGYGVEPGQVATSAQAAATLLQPSDRVFVVGGEGLVEAVAGVAEVTTDWRAADVVVVGLDPHLSYERLSGAVLAIGNGARFLASNHDPTYPAPEGLRPGAGAIVEAIAHATARRPEIAGKPHIPMQRLLADRARGNVWIVGDRDDTDLAMGRAAGWRTARVATGVRDESATPPDIEAADLAAVVDHLLA
ncbi:MAG: HAD-IIA family hydrolase [Acidimicrobiia bacterium]|nr:HAD-IIA family hydrolase [Acidimicrobiia bacterium]